jgi:hypothetical protein
VRKAPAPGCRCINAAAAVAHRSCQERVISEHIVVYDGSGSVMRMLMLACSRHCSCPREGFPCVAGVTTVQAGHGAAN